MIIYWDPALWYLISESTPHCDCPSWIFPQVFSLFCSHYYESCPWTRDTQATCLTGRLTLNSEVLARLLTIILLAERHPTSSNFAIRIILSNHACCLCLISIALKLSIRVASWRKFKEVLLDSKNWCTAASLRVLTVTPRSLGIVRHQIDFHRGSSTARYRYNRIDAFEFLCRFLSTKWYPWQSIFTVTGRRRMCSQICTQERNGSFQIPCSGTSCADTLP
jgi:hypothetical protein